MKSPTLSRLYSHHHQYHIPNYHPHHNQAHPHHHNCILIVIMMMMMMMMAQVDMSKMDIPPALLMKSNDHEISREEETTVILQVIDMTACYNQYFPGIMSNILTNWRSCEGPVINLNM